MFPSRAWPNGRPGPPGARPPRAGAGWRRWKRSPRAWPQRACPTASIGPRPRSTAAPRTPRPRTPSSPRCCRPPASPPRALRGPIGSAGAETFGQVGLDLVEADAFLAHGVAVPDRYRLVVQGVEVDGDAVRGADLVLTAVAAADRAGVVEVGVPVLAQRRGQVAGLGRQVGVARQREHGGLDRREPAVQAQHRPLLRVALGVRRLVLGVRVEQEHQRAAVDAGRGLDHVRDEPLARLLVQVGQVLPGRLRVGGQVEVGAIGDALELAPLGADEVKLVLDVDRALGVVRQLLFRMLVRPQVLRADTQVGVRGHAGVDPVLMPVLVGAGLDEELHLHLLELAGPEDEVARGDLVAERLADLPDAERDLLPRGLQHVLEVDEDALGGLRAQVGEPGLVLDRAQVRTQQPVEHARLGEGAAVAAVRARDVLKAVRRRVVVLLLVGVDELVGPVPLVAERALGERVNELGDVPARLPHLAGQDHRGVQADDIVALGYHRPPPLALDVVLQLDAERAVVPGGSQASVNLAGRVDESPSFAEADNGVETVTAQGHLWSPSGWRSVGATGAIPVVIPARLRTASLTGGPLA